MFEGIDRRSFIRTAAAGTGALCMAPRLMADAQRPDYRGPNVVLIRFGGGVRRREVVDPDRTWAPYFRHELTKRGTLLTDLRITSDPGVETNHGPGTLNLLTGRYDNHRKLENGSLFEARVPTAPTLFEYLRRSYNVPAHRALIVNGEDRTQEEFYSFSNDHLFGVQYRSSVLSLYRYKVHLLRRQIENGEFSGDILQQKQSELQRLEAVDYRTEGSEGQGPRIAAFWENWRRFYGESGLRNPRGDRLLTELAIRALRELRPRLIMVNFNDPDYVHWGNMNHYTRGISIIDRSIRRIVEFCDNDEFYAGNTIFAIVPDCGRDSNRYMRVPCQHHFNSASSRLIFALLMGPGIAAGRVADKPAEQICVAPTLGRMMGLETAQADGAVLEEVMA